MNTPLGSALGVISRIIRAKIVIGLAATPRAMGRDVLKALNILQGARVTLGEAFSISWQLQFPRS